MLKDRGDYLKPAFAAELVAPGRYSADWNRRDDSGRLVVGGVYFSRLQGGGTSESYHVVRLE